ncbi:MAG: PhnE/PtxC family ABC transporter permease [Desulfitobacterium sp.]
MQAEESISPLTSLESDRAKLRGSVLRKPLNKSSLAIQITLTVLALLTVYAFLVFDYKDINVGQASLATLENFRIMFFEPMTTHFTLREAGYEILITLALAFLTTLLGGILALFLGLLAAENLSNGRVSKIIRSCVAFVRAVPTILWVLIFAVAAGLGSVAAVIGMSFHSISYLSKAYSESFEEMDPGVIEAMKASGASWWQIVFQAVLPSSITYLLSWTFLRFEINFGIAVAMGAAAGAGGIGFNLYMASGHYFDLREVGLITYLILFIAIILESFSTRMKAKVQVKG